MKNVCKWDRDTLAVLLGVKSRRVKRVRRRVARGFVSIYWVNYYRG